MNPRSELLETEDMQVDRPRADRAAAWERDARAAATRHQRSQNQAGRPHRLDQLIWSLRAHDSLGVEADDVALDLDAGADIYQQPLHRPDIAYSRDAVQRDGFIR